MRIIICLDDRGGLSFGGRRLSRDRALIDFICSRYENIAVDPYSAPLFDGHAVTVADDPYTVGCDSCFLENTEIKLDVPRLTSLLYADGIAPIHLIDGWKLHPIGIR